MTLSKSLSQSKLNNKHDETKHSIYLIKKYIKVLEVCGEVN